MHHAQRVGARKLLAVRQQAKLDVAFAVRDEPLDHARPLALLDRDRFGQTAQRLRRHKRERLRRVGGRIAPPVLRDQRQPERLAHDRKRRHDRLPARGRPRHQIERRMLQLAELIRRERIHRGAQLDILLHVGLQSPARRSLPPVAEADGQRIAGAQIAAPDADQQRVAPGADVEPVEPDLELCAVARLDGGEVFGLRLVELRLAHVGRRPPRDLQHAGVVDAEGACGVDERELLMRAGDERTRRRQRDGPHVLGEIGGVRHGLLRLDVEVFHQPPVLGVIVAHELRERLDRAAGRLLRRVEEVLADRRIGQRLADLAVEQRR